MKDIVTELPGMRGIRKYMTRLTGWYPDFFGVVTWLIPF